MWKRSRSWKSEASAIADRLDHLRAGAAGDLGAEGGALVAVQLHVREADRVGGPGDLVEPRVDEHADGLDAAAQRPRDAGRDRRVGARGDRSQRMNPIAHAPSSTASSASSDRVMPQTLTRVTPESLRRGVPTRTPASAAGRSESAFASSPRGARRFAPRRPRVAGPVGRQDGRHVVHGADRPAAQRLEHVAVAHARRLRRRARLHVLDLHAVGRGRALRRRGRRAPRGPPSRAAGSRPWPCRRGPRSRSPRCPTTRRRRGGDLRVDADDAAARVEQRAPGVARVQGRVGLDDVVDGEARRARSGGAGAPRPRPW